MKEDPTHTTTSTTTNNTTTSSTTIATAISPSGGELFLGTAGYQYQHWRGSKAFYPHGITVANELRYYAQCFNTCEINTTFYGVPSEATVATWIAQVTKVNPRFKFCLKMKKTVTHGGGDIATAGRRGGGVGGSGGGGGGGGGEQDTTGGDAHSPSPAAAAGSPPSSPSHRKSHHNQPTHPHTFTPTIPLHQPLSPEALSLELPLFFDRARQLPKAHRAPILFQFPPSFSLDLGALERLAEALAKEEAREEELEEVEAKQKQGGGGEEEDENENEHSSPFVWQYAMEFRHASWFTKEVYSYLTEKKWALAQHCLPNHDLPEVEVNTAGFHYLRLHGLKTEHAWDYTRTELQPYVDTLCRWRREENACAYVFFLNDSEAMAPANAMLLAEMVCERTQEKNQWRKPEAGMQLTRFFKKKEVESTDVQAHAHAHAHAHTHGKMKREQGEGGEEGGEEGKGKKLKTGEEAGGGGGGEERRAAAATAASPPPPSPKRGGGGGGGGGKDKNKKSAEKATPRITQFFSKAKKEE